MMKYFVYTNKCNDEEELTDTVSDEYTSLMFVKKIPKSLSLNILFKKKKVLISRSNNMTMQTETNTTVYNI